MALSNTRSGIHCPECSGRTRVLTTEHGEEGTERRRLCRDCNTVVITREVPLGKSLPESEMNDLGGHPCPECHGPAMVLQTRNAAQMVRRKRCCTDCAHVFQTKEYPTS